MGTCSQPELAAIFNYKNMKEIIQIKISIEHSNPVIWREILLQKDTSFFELHHIIQIAMGWHNYHLFEFNLEGYRIGEIIEDDITAGFGSDQLLDAKEVKLADVISDTKEYVNYLYDFGDNWRHKIKVEKFLDRDDALQYPVCMNGQMNCPPEDCGGTASFYYYLDILNNKKHPEYKQIKEWFPKKYDAITFDKEKTNKQLGKLKSYISRWMKGQ